MKKLHLVIKTDVHNGKQEYFIFSKQEKAAAFVDDESTRLNDDNWAEFETEQLTLDSEAV